MGDAGRPRGRRSIRVPAPVSIVVLLVALGAGACSSGDPEGRDTDPVSTSEAAAIPPPPPTPAQSLGPDQPPVIWIGGTLIAVADDQLELEESSGSRVMLVRLGEDTTGFFRVSGSRWARLPPEEQPEAGEEACVEALMAGTRFLALRVFLGAGCGPA